MEKIIIKNESDLEMTEVLTVILSIISKGRVSNNGKQYCFLTVVEIDNKEYDFVSNLAKKSDVFTIYKSNRKL